MGADLKYCENCGERIREIELRSGKAVEVFDKTYCPRCRAEYVAQMGGAAPPEPPPASGGRRPTGRPTAPAASAPPPRRKTGARGVSGRTAAPKPGPSGALIAGGVVFAVVVVVAFGMILRGPGRGAAPPPVQGGGTPPKTIPLVDRPDPTATLRKGLATVTADWTRAQAAAGPADIAALKALHDRAEALLIEVNRRQELLDRRDALKQLIAATAEHAARALQSRVAAQLPGLEARCQWDACLRATRFPAWLQRTEAYTELVAVRAEDYARWVKGEHREGELPWIESRIDYALTGSKAALAEQWIGRDGWDVSSSLITGRAPADQPKSLTLGGPGWLDVELAFQFMIKRGGFAIQLRRQPTTQVVAPVVVEAAAGRCQVNLWYEMVLRVEGEDLFHKVRRVDTGEPTASAVHAGAGRTPGPVAFRLPPGAELLLRNVRYRVRAEATAPPPVTPDPTAWRPVMQTRDAIELLSQEGQLDVTAKGVLKVTAPLDFVPRTGRWADFEWEFQMRRLRGKFGIHVRAQDKPPGGGFFLLTEQQAPFLKSERWATLTIRYERERMSIKFNGKPVQFSAGKTTWRVRMPTPRGRPMIKLEKGSAEFRRFRIRALK